MSSQSCHPVASLLVIGALVLFVVGAAATEIVRIFEMQHSGGYGDARGPDRMLDARVEASGQFSCHCPDYSLKSIQLSDGGRAQLEAELIASGFFDLPSEANPGGRGPAPATRRPKTITRKASSSVLRG